MLLTIRDETASGSITNTLTLDILTESLPIRELIRSRVYQEVQDFNLKQRLGALDFQGLVTPSDAELRSTGARLRRAREIDWKEQFDKACDAFTKNGILILVDDRQAESLDEVVTLRHDTKVGFIKLTMLVGG